MEPGAAKANETLETSSLHVDPNGGTGVLNDIQALWQELHGLSHAHIRLAALEARRAGQSLLTMLVAGVMLALLLNGVWLGLLVAGAVWLIENGLQPSSVILLSVAFNLCLLLMMCGVIRRHSRYLKFPALLRHLRIEEPNKP